MPYNPNIPVALQALKDSQPLLRINFSDMQSVFSKDHMLIGGNFNGGHAIIHFPVQAADPAPGADQIALYAKKYTTATDLTELYVYKSGGTPIPMTATKSTASGGVTVYWTFLPNGLLMKFGEASFTGSKVVALDITGQPQFTSILSTLSSTKTTLPTGNYSASATTTALTLTKSGSTTMSFCVIGVGDPTPA